LDRGLDIGRSLSEIEVDSSTSNNLLDPPTARLPFSSTARP
jgi:hypothetical protein